jgi:hypothetical protein
MKLLIERAARAGVSRNAMLTIILSDALRDEDERTP